MKERQELTVFRGILMFAILLLGYITFVMNWVAGSNLSKQIEIYFLGNVKVDPVVSEVVNYTITIARIFANFLAAFVMMKLSHRKATTIAFILLCFSYLAVHTKSHWMYTGARMVMSLGGSMLMVYINTIVARFIPSNKRIISSALTTASYNVGALIVALIFFFFKDSLEKNWQNTMSGFSILSIVFFILWLIIGRDFSSTSNQNNVNEQAEIEEYGYTQALKDKFIYLYSMGFGAFLFLYVMSLVSIPKKLELYLGGGDFRSSMMLLSVSLGGVAGTLFSILIRNISFRRKPYLLSCGILMIVAMALGLFLIENGYVHLGYLFFAISGFGMFAQYTIYLNIPYEMKNMNPKKLTIMFGLFWAFGYAVYTILNVLWSLVLKSFSWNISMVFYMVCSSVYVFFVLTFPETKPTKKLDLK